MNKNKENLQSKKVVNSGKALNQRGFGGLVAILVMLLVLAGTGILVFNKSSDTPDFIVNVIEKVKTGVEVKENIFVGNETCQEHYQRLLSEGWKTLSKEGNFVVVQDPSGGVTKTIDLSRDVLTIRPTGDYLNEFDGGTYLDVDDTGTGDDGATTIYEEGSPDGIVWDNWLGTWNPGSTVGTISSITLYARPRHLYNSSSLYLRVKIGSNYHDSTLQTISGQPGGPNDYSTLYSKSWTTNPSTSNAWNFSEISSSYFGVYQAGWYSSPVNYSGFWNTQVYIEVTYTVTPTVTLSAATNKEATTATLNGNVTAIGGENPTVTVYWGTSDGGQVPASWTYSSAPTSPSQPQGVAAFYKSATGLPSGTTIYFSAKATNSAGTSWPAASLSFLTKPAAPTNVAATDGSNTAKVVITWTKSTGATNYHVWRDAVDLGAAGDVATFDDTGAAAPTITPGTAAASDGASTAYVSLSLSGQSANNGTTYTYKVVASNATGNSADSATNTGYRGVGALTYQWQRSAADSDATYSNITGATTASYNDTGAPADGSGRYYKCVENATGATQQISTSDRGYRAIAGPTITTSAASSVTGTTATLNGNVTATGGENPTVTVYWGTSDGGQVPASWTYSSAPTSPSQPQGVAAFTKDVTDLSPGTTYFFSAKATNSGGTGWGTTQTFNSSVVAPTVTNSTGVSNITTIGARLNGEVTITGGENPTVHIYWGDNDGVTTAGNWDTDVNLGAKAAGTFFHNITGLSAGTTYYYRSYATNSGGNDWANSTESFVASVPPRSSGISPSGGGFLIF